MIKLEESAGDIRLCKFIYVMTGGKVGDINKNYIEPLQGYIYVSSYNYNLLYPDAELVPEHNDIIKYIPEDVWEARVDYMRGTIDFWKDEIQLRVDFPEKFFKREVTILRKLFDKYLRQRIPAVNVG